MKKTGVTLLPRRVAEKIEIAPSGCWLWQGGGHKPRNNRTLPYGRLMFKAKRVYAHRLVFELLVGEIPEGLQIDHLCKVPRCVNPNHLEPVTARENVRRGTQGDANRAKRECHRGHAFTVEGTYLFVDKDGSVHRHCRECMRLRRPQRKGYRKGRGYSWDGETSKWRVGIYCGGKQIEGGRFVDEQDAKDAAAALRSKYE